MLAKLLSREIGKFVFAIYILNIAFYLFSVYDYTINYLYLYFYLLLDINFKYNHSLSLLVSILIYLSFYLVLLNVINSSY